ncbi:MAG: hypothetical protein ACK5UQ_05430 [Planctomycetota bacterium]
MTRRAAWVVLCEDEQHYAFAKRFLDKISRPELREVRKAVVDGHSHVRANFAKELAAVRSQGGRAALLVIVDADGHGVDTRRKYIQELCEEAERPVDSDPVAIVVPERNIETWIRWLDGASVDDQTRYPKLRKERDCKPAVARLRQACDANSMPDGAPNSLVDACKQFRRVLALLNR